MNYKFLASKQVTKFFEETELSVGQIIRAITQEKLTGIEIKNKGRLEEISDEEWYEILEKSFAGETGDDKPLNDIEWKEFIKKSTDERK